MAAPSTNNLVEYYGANGSPAGVTTSDMVDRFTGSGSPNPQSFLNSLGSPASQIPIDPTHPMGGLAAPSTGTPMTDLSKMYGETNVNGNNTIFNRQTGQQFADPNSFFQDAQKNGYQVSSFNGLNFDPSKSLNDAQGAAYNGLTGQPTDDVDQMKQTAQTFFDNAQANVTADAQNKPNSDLNAAAESKYNELGINDLMQKVADAQADLEKTKVQQADDLTQKELQYQGGGTEGFAQNQDQLAQRGLKLDEIAKSIQLQTYQSLLSSKVDAWKEFNNVSATQQRDAITEWSTKLGLDKQDLTVGVQLLNQARQEANGNEQNARQLLFSLATQSPDVFQALTPQDRQDIANGKTTPSIIAHMGQGVLIAQQKLNIQQQRANTYMSNTFGQAYGLSQYGGPANGTPTQTNIHDQQTYNIAQQRLANSARSAVTGGQVDGVTTAQDMANTIKNYNLVPPELRGFFQVKKDSNGNTYLVSKVTTGKNGTANAFAQAYTKYQQDNTSATYIPQGTPTNEGAYDPNVVASNIQKDLTNGKGWNDIRATAMSNGVPLTVYKNAVKQVLTAQNH